MFAEGDIVSTTGRTPFDPPEFQKYELSASIESTPEGAFVYVERNPRGEVVKQELINTNLSPTGDPAEAYKVQARNQGLDFAQKSLVSAAGLYGGKSLLTGIGKKAVEKFGPSIMSTLGSRFSPVNLKTKSGFGPVAIAGPKGVQARDPSKLSSYNINVKPTAASTLGLGASLTALGAGQTTEADIQEEISELENQQTAQAKSQKQIDEETASGDADFTVVTTGEQDKKSAEKQKSEQGSRIVSDPTPEQKQASIFQTKNFSDLIRNIGIKMVDTGDIGAGIAEGSALTAIEDKAAEQATGKMTEFQEFLAKEQFKNINELVNDVEYADALSESVLKTETADVMVNYLKQAKSLIEQKDVTGVVPVAKEAVNKAARFLGMEVPQSPREQAKALLSFVSKADVKELLGESGRTISNIDRSIAEELVGKIAVITGKEDLLAQLEKSISKYEDSYAKNLRNYESRIKQYQKFDLTPPFLLGKSIQTPQEVKRVRLKLN